MRKFIFCGFAFCCVATATNATESITQIYNIEPENVVKTVVILTQPNISTRFPLTEKYLPDYGCTFTSTGNIDKTKKIVQIIDKNFKRSERKNEGFPLRNAVYIHMKNDNIVKILLSDSINADKAVLGDFILSSSDSFPIKGDDSALKQLRSWSKTDVERKASSQNLCEFN